MEKTGEESSNCMTCGHSVRVIFAEDDVPTQVNQKQDLLQIPEHKNLYLEILEGPNAGNIYQVLKPNITLGRGSKSDLVLPESGISRKHCAIEISIQKTVLRDLGSTNGTFVSGQRIDFVVLRNQTEFTIGSSRIRYIETPRKEDY
jgi:pSer/pThr/pTyr-binding forkhead associated (FHA) protein